MVVFCHNKFNISSTTFFPGSNGSAPCVILGDEAFPLKTKLLRPHPSQQSINDDKKRHFNYRLCRARRVVENGFGILSQKFRIYNRRLHLKTEFAEKIVLTTCILYNFIRRGETVIFTETNTPVPFNNLRHQRGNAVSTAFEVRHQFADFFQTAQGQLNWIPM